ncbi:hypothetical protein [Salipiger pentaromativorans]|uniref:hypothetical protein n=1 Tax=Salipiger pentaromativorans TaxID=2943193 RepID=UPI002157D4C6|nr:hypothetical protein [Salipiger pentaromativorans]
MPIYGHEGHEGCDGAAGSGALRGPDRIFSQAGRIVIDGTVTGAHSPTESMPAALPGPIIAEARINLLEGRAKTAARVSRGDLSDGDFSLSSMSSEIAAQDRISETTLPIGPKSVPDWSRAMWAEAKGEA